MRRPLSGIWRGSGHPSVGAMTYRFRIDATGRPLSIRPDPMPGPVPASWAQDIAPSLAASQFAGGAAQPECSITYTLRATSPAETPVGNLISYSLTPLSGKLPADGWARIFSPESTCLKEPRPNPLMAAFPDFNKLPGTPGVRDWTMIAYDQDKRGDPVRVRTAYGTGNAALDRAGVEAFRKSRFTGGARAGCMYPYWRSAATLAAPEAPAEDALRPAGSNCSHSDDWARPPAMRYPQAYQRRSIEGWAVVAFDVAPWGELGNLRVLASEPTSDFGVQATGVLRRARKPASATGLSGCVERVFFRIAPGGLSPDA
jgi:TonB family protein